MGFTVLDRKILWGQSGGQCAFHGCEQELIIRAPASTTHSTSSTVIGEEAHIRSQRPIGPRYDPSFPVDDIDSPPNVILLCPTHHTQIDKDVANWPVEKILEMKRDHEAHITTKMSATDARRLKIDIDLATKVQEVDTSLLSKYRNLSLGLTNVIPCILELDFESLKELNIKFLSWDWPSEYPEVKNAAERLRLVLSSLLECVHDSFVLQGTVF